MFRLFKRHRYLRQNEIDAQREWAKNRYSPEADEVRAQILRQHTTENQTFGGKADATYHDPQAQ